MALQRTFQVCRCLFSSGSHFALFHERFLLWDSRSSQAYYFGRLWSTLFQFNHSTTYKDKTTTRAIQDNFKSQLMELMTRLPVSWTSFCQLEQVRTTRYPAPWHSLISWTFPDVPTSPDLSFPIHPITQEEFFATEISALRPLSAHYQPLDFSSFLNSASTATPDRPVIYWALVWSPTESSPVLVRLSSDISLCPNYSIEHWVLSPNNQTFRDSYGKRATNHDFFIPCSSPGCLSYSQTGFASGYHSHCCLISSLPLLDI